MRLVDEDKRRASERRVEKIETGERRMEREREKFDRRGELPWKRVVLSHPDSNKDI